MHKWFGIIRLILKNCVLSKSRQFQEVREFKGPEDIWSFEYNFNTYMIMNYVMMAT